MSLPWRTVSLFVSSTFRDTQLERDILVRRVFPRLRQRLSKHRINLAEIDLRWGVTSEQDSVQVCEEVLKESLPRFLGIIGARYGWIPDKENPEGISITEREMRMALEYPTARPVFLLRDPAVPDGLSDPDSLTDADDEANLASKQAKLGALLDFVRSSKSDIYTYQATATNGLLSLGTTFEDTAYAAILSSLENDSELAPWFELSAGDTDVSFTEAAQAFAHERTRGFNASLRSSEIADLDVASKTDGYVLVTGGGGLGKSSLVAQAYLSALAGGDRKVVGAFVGGMRGTGSSHELLTNLVRSLADDPLETEMIKLAEQFLSALHSAKPLLFLDGLDQLTDAGHLLWLPYGLPAGTTVVISTMDDTLAQPFRDRGAVEVRVDALSLADARTVLLGHLHRYRKVLEPRQVDALLAKTDATSPLYLACVAEELRTLGVREELDRHIAAMAPDVGGLFLWVLRRLESDRQFRWDDGVTKVRRLLSCIGVSRDGLSESELCGLVDDASGDVAVLLRLLQPYLSRRGDLLSLHHRAHGEALRGIGIGEESRRLLDDEHPGYLDEDSEIDAAREILANFFDGTGSTVVPERQAYEWPHQLFHLKAWDRLEQCLLTRVIFEHLRDDERKWELTGYWLPLRAEPLSRDMGALYLEAFEKWKTGDLVSDIELATSVGLYLLRDSFCHDLEPLFRFSFETCVEIYGTNSQLTLRSMNNLASYYNEAGNLSASEQMYRDAIRISETVFGSESEEIILLQNNLGLLYGDTEQYEYAEKYLRANVSLRENLVGNLHPETLSSQNNLATLLQDKQEYSEAESLYRKVLNGRISMFGIEHPDTLCVLNNLGSLLVHCERYAEANEVFRGMLAVCERVMGPKHPNTLTVMNNVAYLCQEIGRHDDAVKLFKKVIDNRTLIFGQSHQVTLLSLDNLAHCYLDHGNIRESISTFRQKLHGYELLYGHASDETLTCLTELCQVLIDNGRLSDAKALYLNAIESFEIAITMQTPTKISIVYALGRLCEQIGDMADAEKYYLQELEACEHFYGADHPETMSSIENSGRFHLRIGNTDYANQLHSRLYEISKSVFGELHPKTLKNAKSRACLLISIGNLDEAEQVLRLVLRGYAETCGKNSKKSLNASIMLADTLRKSGDMKSSLIILNRVFKVLRRKHGRSHPKTRKVRSCIQAIKDQL